MDLPSIEDRLDNMAIVAALERALDALSERFGVLQRGLEAETRSLKRERQPFSCWQIASSTYSANKTDLHSSVFLFTSKNETQNARF